MTVEHQFNENDKHFLTGSVWPRGTTCLDRGAIRGFLGRLKNPLDGDDRKQIIKDRVLPVLRRHAGDEDVDTMVTAFTEEVADSTFDALYQESDQ